MNFNTIKSSKHIFISLLNIFKTKEMPIGRWIRDDNYIGSMSNIANINTDYNNHDHCGGDLCKYPPLREQYCADAKHSKNIYSQK
tara:strand:+ start:6570 stop:6824 length:255 start_codon:yes stop_codon:yes gene_type:complete